MPALTAVIITKNEAAHIAAAIRSVAFADEILVVDSHSDDDTQAIAAAHGARVMARDFDGYIGQKNFAAGIARHDWILSVDADERVTEPLAEEIRETLAAEPSARGYRVPRASFYLGRCIRSTDWYPDYQLRLYDRRVARWDGRYVHESVRVDGPTAHLHGELLHYPYRDIAHHIDTINRYTTLAAQQMYESGRRAGLMDLIVHPPAAFLRNYVLRGGFREGAIGFVVSCLNSYYVAVKFAKLWELRRREVIAAEAAADAKTTVEPPSGAPTPAATARTMADPPRKTSDGA